MKKQMLALLIVFLFCNSQLFAQVKDSVVLLPQITITSTVKVSNALENALKKSFPEAENLRWYKHDKDYLARFIKNDMDHNTLYKKNGYMKYDISYGTEKNLPGDVRNMVQSSYQDFKITRAINVKEGGRDIWVVNLEGLKNYVTVRVEGQDLEEVERYNKAE